VWCQQFLPRPPVLDPLKAKKSPYHAPTLPNPPPRSTIRDRPRFSSPTKRNHPFHHQAFLSNHHHRVSIDNKTATMADNDSPVTLRTRKFIRNPLLGRKQMVV
jgi:hypothetical protein